MKLWFDNGAWASRKGVARAKALQPEQVKKIAVIRHAALGDMILTRPFLHELRRCFPNAQITLSIVTNYTRGTPDDLVDRIHTAYGSDRKDVSIRQQVQKARELGPQDLIFDLAATPRSFWLCLLNKASLKVGFPYYASQRKLLYDICIFRSDLHFETDCLLDMLNIFGFTTSYPPLFDLPGKTHKTERHYIVYFTSASTPIKCWPQGHYADLIARLSQDYPAYDHVVLEGREAWESIEEIIEKNRQYTNVQGVNIDSLDETIALIKGARMVISNDTGIRHLAIAAQVPCIGIFFSAENHNCLPFRYWPRYQHEIVLNTDGSVPSVEKVYDSSIKLLQSMP